ncbi:MAG: hypothetical protein H7A55_14185 [Verrucomicrobiaceae bacterium]|nr:hypothetical protein [Verrucomicrobiaceae bacterium]
MFSIGWLRALIFGVPLAAGLAGWWAAQGARASRENRTDDLVAMLPGAVPVLNPFLPGDEITRQICDLVYAPVLRIDSEGRLMPGIAEHWDWDLQLTCWFLNAEKATAAAEKLKAIDADQWLAWKLDEVMAKDNEVVLRFSDPDGQNTEAALEHIADLQPEPASVVRVEVAEQARQYYAHFLENAVGAGDIRRVWFDGDIACELVVSGEVNAVVAELENYYSAQQGLNAKVRVVGNMSALREPLLSLHLRPDLRWDDGSAVTAADVKATVNYVLGQPWPVPNRDAFAQIQSMEVLADDRLRVAYRRRLGVALLAWVELPILPEPWTKGHPADVAGAVFAGSMPPGCGDFKVLERDERALVLAPAAAMEKQARFSQIQFRRGDSPFNTQVAFATGTLDLFWPGNEAARDLLRREGLVVRGAPPASRMMVLCNTRSGPLADVRVRAALELATDREALIHDLLAGRGRAVDGVFPPGFWFSPKQVPRKGADLDAAADLLKEAGWLKDVHGVAKKPGEQLTIELLTTAGNEPRERLAAALAEQWSKIGVVVKVVPVSWNEFIGVRLGQREFEAAILGLDYDASWDQLLLWHSSQAGPGGLNFSGVQDRQLDLQLESLAREFDVDQVAGHVAEVEKILTGLRPVIPLIADLQQTAVRTGLLAKDAPADDSQPWTLRDLLLKHAAPADARPALPMMLPKE